MFLVSYLANSRYVSYFELTKGEIRGPMKRDNFPFQFPYIRFLSTILLTLMALCSLYNLQTTEKEPKGHVKNNQTHIQLMLLSFTKMIMLKHTINFFYIEYFFLTGIYY